MFGKDTGSAREYTTSEKFAHVAFWSLSPVVIDALTGVEVGTKTVEDKREMKAASLRTELRVKQGAHWGVPPRTAELDHLGAQGLIHASLVL